MAQEQIIIRTDDGECPTHVLTPEGEGPWPAVIVYMDAGGIRPAIIEIAQRLADAGHVALLPDLFYRAGEYHIPSPKELFEKGNLREVVGPLMATTGPRKAADDTRFYIEYLDSRSDIAGRDIGTVGFCMGGGVAIAAAGTFPDRIAAAASFHGGRLATGDPTSPHLLAPDIAAEVYVAGADEDGSYPPDMQKRLREAFDDAGVAYREEIYEGAHHGWMLPDFPTYEASASERGWREMLALFDRALR